MVILLEGADGAGKSTLYEELRTSLSKNKFKFIKHLDRDADGHHSWWKNKIDSETIYVIDRGFVSELIYRPIKKDKVPNITLDEISDICNDNLIIVYCKTDRQLSDMLNRGDDYIDKEEYPKIVNYYDAITDVFKWFTDVIVYDYDWTKDSLKDLTKFIEVMTT